MRFENLIAIFGLILIVYIVPTHAGQAQVVESKQIYLWDVTFSMKQNNIWDQVKVLLKKNISEIPDKSTEVIVIPYQDDVFQERRFKMGDDQAVDKFLTWVSEYEVPLPKGGHGTNICRALERAQDFVVKEKINTVYLLTDGVHEPKRSDMFQKYPPGCLDDFICTKWCEFASTNNAFLVYYQLFGTDYNLKKCSKETCRISFIPPDKSGKVGPDLYSITPKTTLISKDKTFFSKPIIFIPVTTTVPVDKVKFCNISAHISTNGFSETFPTQFDGNEIKVVIPSNVVSNLKDLCKNSLDYCKLMLKFEINKNSEFNTVITPNVVPMRIKNSGERWIEIKVLPE